MLVEAAGTYVEHAIFYSMIQSWCQRHCTCMAIVVFSATCTHDRQVIPTLLLKSCLHSKHGVGGIVSLKLNKENRCQLQCGRQVG